MWSRIRWGGKFYRLGYREYQFVRLLDGTATVSAIVGRMAARDGGEALNEHEALALVRGLADMGLMEVAGGDHASRLYENVHLDGEAERVMGKGKSLFFLRIPLGNPDQLLGRMAKRVGWLTGPFFFALWLLVVGWAWGSLAGQWPRFRNEMGGMFQVGHLAWLWVAWVALKVIHEFWHGLVCKKFGGSVPEMGVTLLLLVTPLGYVEASSSLAFPSKWRRIFVSAAGMYGEIFVAAVAVLVWARLEPGVSSAVLQQVIMISSVTTILFNANPLMRFDGYYILADLIEIPNLYAKGQRVVVYWGKKYLLGIKEARYPLGEHDQPVTIGLYGIAAFVWRMVVMLGLFLIAVTLFKGAGVVLAAVVGVMIAIGMLRSIKEYFSHSAQAEKTRVAKVALRVAILVVLLGGLGFFVQIKPSAKISGVVEVSGRKELRINCPGFMDKVYVDDGQWVKKGDPLVRLRNLEQSAWLERLKLDRRRSEVRSDLYYQNEELSSYQAEQRQIESLDTKISEQEAYVASLDIRAESDGRVYARGLRDMQDQYLAKGTLLMVVGREREKELVLAVPQDRIDYFRDSAGREIRFRVDGRAGESVAVAKRVSPRATVEIPHFSLATVAGGPLVVRNRQDGDNAARTGRLASSQQVLEQFELAQAHFMVKAKLSEKESERLAEGERVRAQVFDQEKLSLAELVWRKLEKYVGNSRGLVN